MTPLPPHYVHMQYLTEASFAFVDPTCWLGKGVKVWHFARVLAHCRLGDGVSIGGGAEIGFGCVIGADSRISSGVFLPSNSLIGERVFIGPNVTCTDDRTPRVPTPGDPPYVALPPIIKDDASIGAGAVILPGITIGRGARIGAGAIVTRDVPAFGHVRGEPARQKALSESSRDWTAPSPTPLPQGA